MGINPHATFFSEIHNKHGLFCTTYVFTKTFLLQSLVTVCQYSKEHSSVRDMSGTITSSERIHDARQLAQDPSQSSSNLLPQVIATGSENDGQSNNPDNILEIPSLTSTNNFINFCVNLPLTNGEPSQQLSCNPAPMGHIPAPTNIPSTRFKEPHNGDVFLENSAISVTLTSNNLAIGNAVNPGLNYLAAPQQLNAGGLVLGHCHLVVDALESFGQVSPTDPTKPVFFAEVGTPTAQSLSTTVTLPAGFYRMTATVHAANHQPVVVPIEQHGSLDDVVYFIVQPNPKSRRSIRQTGLLKWRHYFSTRQKSKGNTRFSWNGMTRRQDPSTSLTLNSSVIASAFSQDGTNGTTGVFTPSLTSTNNFINYCATLTGVPLTNGTESTGESCNPVPIGLLPSVQNMPSVKFTSPAFNDTIQQNTPFQVSLNVTNLVSGKSTNSKVNFLSAPQQLVQAGRIIGHTGIVIEEYPTDAVPNPEIFSLATTIDASGSSSSGIFTFNMTTGLPIGFYRLSSLVSTANHQPVVMPYPDHGAINDVIFFSVTENGGGPPPLPTLSTVTSTTPTSTGSTGSAAPNNTTSSEAQTQTPHKTQSMAGKVAGIVIGATFVLGIALAAVFLWKRRKFRKETARFPIHDNQIGLTPFEDWREGDPNMIYNSPPIYDPPPDHSNSKNISPRPSAQVVSRDNLLASTSNLLSPSTMRKSTRQGTNMAGGSSSNRSENPSRRSTGSRISLAPSYHTTAG